MKNCYSFLSIIALFSGILALPIQSQQASNLPARIDALVKPCIAREYVVGMTVGLITRDRKLVRGYGTLNIGGKEKPDGDTIYEIGSITKTFTGILLAWLATEGKLKLTDPVQALLPRGAVIPGFGKRQITLVDLATHTSALPRMPANFKPRDITNPYADYTVKQMLDFLAGLSLTRAPGEKQAYSNLGVGLLGHALACRAGCSYETLLTKGITGPLCMKNTQITFTPQMKKRLAQGHQVDLQPAANWDIPTLAGAGAIRSSVNDMLIYVTANLTPDKSALGQAIALAQQPHFKPTVGRHMGLGWFIGGVGEARMHNGRTGGYSAYLHFDRITGNGVIILANTATGLVTRLGNDIIALLAGKKVRPRPFPKPVKVAEKILQEYVGQYRLGPNFVITVTRQGGYLLAQATGQQRLRIFPESKSRFHYRQVKAVITFKRNSANQVTGLVLHQGGRDMPAKKIKKASL